MKYGYDAFTLEILEYCDEYCVLIEREQYFFDTVKPSPSRIQWLDLTVLPLSYYYYQGYRLSTLCGLEPQLGSGVGIFNGLFLLSAFLDELTYLFILLVHLYF